MIYVFIFFLSVLIRNLFLLSGTDGMIRMFHLLEKQPIRMWEPTPPPGASGTYKYIQNINKFFLRSIFIIVSYYVAFYFTYVCAYIF